MHVQLYKGGQSVWATGTDRGQTKPTVLNVQVRVQPPLPLISCAAVCTPFYRL